MGNLKKLAGHERIMKLIRKAGGIPKEFTKCPSCGGVVVILDDQLRDNPLCSRQYRYTIQCKDQDCMSVEGPSVKWCIEQWMKDCKSHPNHKEHQSHERE